MRSIPIKVKRLESAHDLPLPSYATEGSAGMDIVSNETVELDYGEIKMVGTGIAVSIPPGYEIQFRPRSGLATKGITVMNTPGTIDSDYRGELKAILVNHSTKPFLIERGERIAQLVPAETIRGELYEVLELDDTARGSGGFGSTGR